MREWNLKAGDPISLTLAADARLGPTDYLNDHAWELRLAGGEPSALALYTTFGLRARSYRLFPRFCLGDVELIDPAEFHIAPTIRNFYPNFIRLHCEPFTGLEVQLEYWVPASQAACLRMRLHNRRAEAFSLELAWLALLAPDLGERMAPRELQAVQVLAGATGDLSPLLFTTGGAQAISSPFPALQHKLTLAAGESANLDWVHCACTSIEESFDQARSLAARSWEAEFARLELFNAGQLEIHTGSLEWDIALALSQQKALGMLLGPSAHLPHLSFVQPRQPDQGHSLRGDGSDYPELWSGQPALSALYLAGFLLPGYPDVVQGILRNYLAAPLDDGSLDWRPGLAGQRGLFGAPPVLAGLAWRAYQVSRERAFLEEAFPPLLEMLNTWFSAAHDIDEDGWPEWEHPLQAGFEDHPLFAHWQPEASGLEISSVESPALAAWLYQECLACLQIATELGRQDVQPRLRNLTGYLSSALGSAWQPEHGAYTYVDRDTHQASRGQRLAGWQGTGDVTLDLTFDQPVRLLIKLHSQAGTALRPRLVIMGSNRSGQHRVEHLGMEDFRWYAGHGVLTGQRIYGALERIDVQGIGPEDAVEIYTVDLMMQDISLLLGLWAGMLAPERAAELVQRQVMDPHRFWQPFGLLSYLPAGGPAPADQSIPARLSMPWNSLVGLGLLRYDFRQHAAELVRRLMRAVTQNLREHGAFFNEYDPTNGQGRGERNTISGLAPLALFMQSLGVEIESPFHLRISGTNPYPWPVTVKYRGLTVLRRKNSAVIHFPNGQSVTVKGRAAQDVRCA